MASRREVFTQGIEEVWQAITDLSGEDRSDLLEVQRISDQEIIQINEYRHRTHYTILDQELYRIFQVEVKGKKVHQIFTAEFQPGEGEVIVDFTLEDLKDGGFRPALFSAFFIDSEKLLLRYIYELRARLRR